MIKKFNAELVQNKCKENLSGLKGEELDELEQTNQHNKSKKNQKDEDEFVNPSVEEVFTKKVNFLTFNEKQVELCDEDPLFMNIDSIR